MAADSPVQRAGRTDRPRSLTPLRRKPKQLTEEPLLYEPAGGGGAPLTVAGSHPRTPALKGTTSGESAPGLTDEPAELLTELPEQSASDLEAIRRAQQIARLLAIPKARRHASARRGFGELTSARYRGVSDEIDLDATLESLAEHPVPEDDDIVVRERLRTKRSVVLVVDVSGSMRGERALTAAATVGAMYGELGRDDLAVIAFWSDAALIVPLATPTAPAKVLESLLRVPSQGLTNVAFPLQVAAQLLARVPPRDARVLLLSDCVHNAGPDPRPVAARLARLDVLLDTTGEHDLQLAKELARAGHGRVATAKTYREVGAAVSRIFDR